LADKLGLVKIADEKEMAEKEMTPTDRFPIILINNKIKKMQRFKTL